MDYALRAEIKQQIEEVCRQLVIDAQSENMGLMTGTLLEISFGGLREELLKTLDSSAKQLGVNADELKSVYMESIDEARKRYLI